MRKQIWRGAENAQEAVRSSCGFIVTGMQALAGITAGMVLAVMIAGLQTVKPPVVAANPDDVDALGFDDEA